MSKGVKHYIWKEGTEAPPINPPEGSDIESRFEGMLYSRCEGLLAKGKRKNIHTETYADSGELRVWMDENAVCREATNITLTLFFTGDNRKAVYDSFCEYISNGKFYYWDTMRKKLAYMVLIDAVKPKEDSYKGSIPYILGEFKLQNLWGECRDAEY